MKLTRNIFIATIAAMLCCGVVSAQQKTLKLISYNILQGMETDTTQGKQVFVEWVKAQNPDIMALQEANYFTQQTLEALAASYGHPYAVIVKEKGYPTAITSKHPIVNVEKVLDNMCHGFIKCKIAGMNIINLHFHPHLYTKRQEEVRMVLETIKESGDFENWMIMGDFNSVSPLDKSKYADGKYAGRLKAAEERNPKQKHLNNGEVDYSVQQSILDFGFVDGARIDFIYLSPDLKKQIVNCGFMMDDFTKKYSDHRPVLLNLRIQ